LPVAVTDVALRSITGVGVGARVGVSVIDTTAVGDGVSVLTGEGGTDVAVSVTEADGSDARAVNVCAIAVWNWSCGLRVGPVPGVGVKPGNGMQAPSNRINSEPSKMTLFFIMPSFGLRLADDLHELGDDVAQHAFR
jgi:hypothetical protein